MLSGAASQRFQSAQRRSSRRRIRRRQTVQHVFGDVLRVRVADPLDFGQVNVADKVIAQIALDRVTAFFADSQDFDCLACCQQLLRMRFASFAMLPLKPPHRPRSAVITTSR